MVYIGITKYNSIIKILDKSNIYTYINWNDPLLKKYSQLAMTN